MAQATTNGMPPEVGGQRQERRAPWGSARLAYDSALKRSTFVPLFGKLKSGTEAADAAVKKLLEINGIKNVQEYSAEVIGIKNTFRSFACIEFNANVGEFLRKAAVIISSLCEPLMGEVIYALEQAFQNPLYRKASAAAVGTAMEQIGSLSVANRARLELLNDAVSRSSEEITARTSLPSQTPQTGPRKRDWIMASSNALLAACGIALISVLIALSTGVLKSPKNTGQKRADQAESEPATTKAVTGTPRENPVATPLQEMHPSEKSAGAIANATQKLLEIDSANPLAIKPTITDVSTEDYAQDEIARVKHRMFWPEGENPVKFMGVLVLSADSGQKRFIAARALRSIALNSRIDTKAVGAINSLAKLSTITPQGETNTAKEVIEEIRLDERIRNNQARWLVISNIEGL